MYARDAIVVVVVVSVLRFNAVLECDGNREKKERFARLKLTIESGACEAAKTAPANGSNCQSFIGPRTTDPCANQAEGDRFPFRWIECSWARFLQRVSWLLFFRTTASRPHSTTNTSDHGTITIAAARHLQLIAAGRQLAGPQVRPRGIPDTQQVLVSMHTELCRKGHPGCGDGHRRWI